MEITLLLSLGFLCCYHGDFPAAGVRILLLLSWGFPCCCHGDSSAAVMGISPAVVMEIPLLLSWGFPAAVMRIPLLLSWRFPCCCCGDSPAAVMGIPLLLSWGFPCCCRRDSPTWATSHMGFPCCCPRGSFPVMCACLFLTWACGTLKAGSNGTSYICRFCQGHPVFNIFKVVQRVLLFQTHSPIMCFAWLKILKTLDGPWKRLMLLQLSLCTAASGHTVLGWNCSKWNFLEEA